MWGVVGSLINTRSGMKSFRAGASLKYMLREAVFRFPPRWVKLQRKKNPTYIRNRCHGKFCELGFLFSWGWQHLRVLLGSGGENILILLLSCHLFKLAWTSKHLQRPWSSLRKRNRTPFRVEGVTGTEVLSTQEHLRLRRGNATFRCVPVTVVKRLKGHAPSFSF